MLWQGLLAHDLPDIAGRQACGLPRDLRFYQYLPEQRFKMHKDGPWLEEGLRSELTLLVYLNEDFQGGATDFRGFQVVPKQAMRSCLCTTLGTKARLWRQGVNTCCARM